MGADYLSVPLHSHSPAAARTTLIPPCVAGQTHYATALAPLEALEAVHMTVGNLGKGPAPLNARHNADMWAGECRQCLETVVYTDAAFRREWAEKKRLALPLDKIAEAQGMGMAEWSEPKRPPLLGQVVWNFWPAVPDLIGLDS